MRSLFCCFQLRGVPQPHFSFDPLLMPASITFKIEELPEQCLSNAWSIIAAQLSNGPLRQ
jgi:hypothetical protein